MLDLLIRDGLVVTPAGPTRLEVGIEAGRIASLNEAGAGSAGAKRVLDAEGLIVVPGGVDPHIHCDMEVPAPGGGPSSFTAGAEVVSRAALHGGTTSLIDFAWNSPGESLARTIEDRLQQWQDASLSDFSLHVVLRGEVDPVILEEIPQVIASGFPSFKIFTTDVSPQEEPTKVPFGSIWEVLQVTAAHRGVVAIHAEDDDLVMHMYQKLRRLGQMGAEHMSQVHSSLSEKLSFRRVIGLAESVPGAVLYMMHVSAASGVEAIAEARARGAAVYGETLHQYALRTEEEYARGDGIKFHTYPSLKSREDNLALWRGVARGDISTFATDELCTPYAIKMQGRQIDDVTGGNTGVEPRMAIVFEEAVVKRKLGLTHFVDLTSANAAKIMGMYPRKGAIAVGSDADLALIDPARPTVIQAAILHESDYTPWEGWKVGAWPVATVLRGEVVVEEGRFAEPTQKGRLLPRSVSPEVQRGRL